MNLEVTGTTAASSGGNQASSVANPDAPSSASTTDKSVPTLSLNPTSPNVEPNINPLTSRGAHTHRPATDALHASNKTVSISQKRVMDEYNRAFSQSTDREKQLTLQYFMGLAAIENELNLYL